ncbi:MAG: DUF1816 domain-containing protein [Cyanosarcina radialis HA8281-LM2]|nr:DUF1816 domain-containing protein [Cyanosarcina radialis HA8281-LM2]
MEIKKTAENLLLPVLEGLGLAWWLKVITRSPSCVYYFGPFMTAKQVELYQAGYLEDLEQEQAQIESVAIEQCQPKFLTSCEDGLEWCDV